MRGVEQIRQLLAEAEAFEQRDAYAFRADIDSRSAQHVTYRCFAKEQEAPPDDWSLRAGEAIQNLRSALDHMVYAASRGRDMTQFPIFTNADKYREKAAAMLTGVPDSVRAVIEKAQPYNSLSARSGRNDA
jgi:hypothetical protein